LCKYTMEYRGVRLVWSPFVGQPVSACNAPVMSVENRLGSAQNELIGTV